jgi:hypothetical protein
MPVSCYVIKDRYSGVSGLGPHFGPAVDSRKLNVTTSFLLSFSPSLLFFPSLREALYEQDRRTILSAMADKYILRVTAGPTYDIASHTEIPVNTASPTSISSELADIKLNVRIQNYTGLPRGSPRTSPYFEQAPHKDNDDQYSICFQLTPKKPPPKAAGEPISDGDDEGDAKGIKASDLQFGNDLDHPVRDRLPPGINTAIRILKKWIDPGLDGDVYADKPYFYGAALSSVNIVHCGAGGGSPDVANRIGLWFEEGGDNQGMTAREAMGAPTDSKARMKWALDAESKEKWVWEYGKTYGLDFFNPYLDFNNFALRLPGFQMGILRLWDGQALR